MLRLRSENYWATFAGFSIGLLVVCLAGTTIMFLQSYATSKEHASSDLTLAASLVVKSIPAETVTSVNEPRSEYDQTAISINSALTSYLKGAEDISSLYVVKKNGSEIYSLYGATNFQSDKRTFNVYEPLTDIHPSTSATLKNTDAEPGVTYTNRWGEWLAVTVPIVDESGSVVGALVAEQPADVLNYHLLEIKRTFIFAGIIALILSLGLASIITGSIVKRNKNKPIQSSARWVRPLIEISLLLIVMYIGTDMGINIINKQKVTHELSNIGTKLRTVDELVGILNSPDILAEQKTNWASAYSPYLSKTILDGISELRPTDTQSLRQTVNKLNAYRDSLFIEYQDQTKVKDAADTRIYQAITVAIILTVLALALVRYTSNRDIQLQELQAKTSESQTRFQNLVENLPVGLFIIENGQFSFVNKEWARQISQLPGDSAQASFESALHPEDKDQVLKQIQDAENEAKPFRLQYRLKNPNGHVSFMESHGTPVYDHSGVMTRMLAFNLDQTSKVKAELGRTQAFEELEQKNELLSSALNELEGNLESVVRALVNAVEAKDPYTAGHSERVMQYSLWLGEAIGLGSYEMRILELGTLVHDVGKIGIPDAILTKPDKLTDEEFDVIKLHPVYGAKIIGDIGLFKECLPIVRWHHERLDGKGYPDGLQGDQISTLVRISSIADIFDAMTSTRAYREGMPVDKVLSIMQKIAENGEIDEYLFTVFCEVIRNKGVIPQAKTSKSWQAA